LVLPRDPRRVRLAAPTAHPPAVQVLRPRSSHEHASQRAGHRVAAVQLWLDAHVPILLSILCSKDKAPALSSGSFRLPHFGLWTHDGQPCSQGQPTSSFAVSSAQPSKTSNPRSVIPTPPACPS